MKIKIGDKIMAAIGIKPREWEVKHIFNDGVTTWVDLETKEGATEMLSAGHLKDAITRSTQTELTEIDI